MASIANRSNYLVTVEGKPERCKKFPFNKGKEAKRYVREQQTLPQEEGQKPELIQLEDSTLVRIRDKGYPLYTAKVSSYEEVEKEVIRVLADRAQGRRA
jgi:hypothetical protein